MTSFTVGLDKTYHNPSLSELVFRKKNRISLSLYRQLFLLKKKKKRRDRLNRQLLFFIHFIGTDTGVHNIFELSILQAVVLRQHSTYVLVVSTLSSLQKLRASPKPASKLGTRYQVYPIGSIPLRLFPPFPSVHTATYVDYKSSIRSTYSCGLPFSTAHGLSAGR
jgi:hypothetical protein